MNSVIKTKRLKERYKSLVHNLSILYSETNIEFHVLLSTKYNFQVDVNKFDNVEPKQSTIQDRFQILLLIDKFNEYINSYKKILESILSKEKYITNIIKNLKTDLCLFITDQKTFLSKCQDLHHNLQQPKITQCGKYFKRWITLSQNEQLERFMSFSTYYIEKMLQNNTINTCEKDQLVETLYNLLKNAHVSKQMIYRDFTWNTSLGIIDKIKILK